MKPLLLSLMLFVGIYAAKAQTKSPDDYLGYPLGSRFTSHQKVVDYFHYVASAHPEIKIEKYGKTYEGRELMVAIVSSKANMARLEEIRQNNVALSQAKSNVNIQKQPAILWLSYNVHGNEASSTETALKMIYTLATGTASNVQQWLDNTVVIIDPCLNPDGRDRYVNFFNSVSGVIPNPNPNSREHQEPWPRGRSNHYYFDLNRDWAWQTQIETQGRIALYQQWMPEVHVDFHEQSYNSPYYFAPAAEPVHESLSKWQRDFQVTVGKNNAKYFDAQGWQYFTKEHFDLLYPSYGDTYPLYNGAIGMTYEQGGINAGLAVTTADGDLLTLKDRIDHHFTTGMATLETVSTHAVPLINEFKQFFVDRIANPPGQYKTYVVKGTQLSRQKKLADLLRKNGIQFSYGGDRNLSGYDFDTQKKKSFRLERNDLVVNLQQPKATLINVLFEPHTMVSDSNTYDITAWAMPYAYGLEAYALKESVQGKYTALEEKNLLTDQVAMPYAWAFSWNSVDDAKLLIALQQENLKVRIADQAFSSGGRDYQAGTLLVYRKENEQNGVPVSEKIKTLGIKTGVSVNAISTGFVEKGKDFGSTVYPLLKLPKISVLSGTETSSIAVGEIWHFFEQELHYPVTMLSVQGLRNLSITETNVLILPSGYYPKDIDLKLASWVEQGGKLILMEDAITAVAGKKPFEIKKKEFPKEESIYTRAYGDKDKSDFNDAIPGAIFKVNLDQTHPLALGLDRYYALVTDDKIYEPLAEGWNVGVLAPGAYLTGIAGKNVQKKMDNGLLYGVQHLGSGTVVYIATNVMFRQFWESGKQLFTNAVFLVN
ncbi:hypothetical protein IWX76_001503 [Pedobacter sp. CAN_A7]|uniref:M14 metallopeptidase family protein n=1 Tax=Pedobacter sp. CAN_A7 TaxID=2787722 RepID=UPI001A27F9CD